MSFQTIKCTVVFTFLFTFILINSSSACGVGFYLGGSYEIIDVWNESGNAIRESVLCGFSYDSQKNSEHIFNYCLRVAFEDIDLHNFRESRSSEFNAHNKLENPYNSNGWAIDLKNNFEFSLIRSGKCNLSLGPSLILLYSSYNSNEKGKWDKTDYGIGLSLSTHLFSNNALSFFVEFDYYKLFVGSNELNDSYGITYLMFGLIKRSNLNVN